MAHRYLQSARNYRPPSGNGAIDLVVRQGEPVVFVEVKTPPFTQL